MNLKSNSLLNSKSKSSHYSNHNMRLKLVATLYAGESFGELALLSDQPRKATVKTKTEWYFAMLGKEDFKNIYGVAQMNKLNRKIDFFQSIPIFCEQNREFLSRFTYYLKDKEVKRNDYLYREGDKWDFWYIIIQGDFELSIKCKIKFIISLLILKTCLVVIITMNYIIQKIFRRIIISKYKNE